MKRHLYLFSTMLILLSLLPYPPFAQPLSATALTQSSPESPESPARQSAPLAGPDLMVESIQFDPERPFTVGVNVDITPVIKNIGDEAAPGLRVNFYINPVDDPPTADTPETTQIVLGIPFAAGATNSSITRTDQPITEEDPQICVWVDPGNVIVEDDDENNLFCIKAPPAPPQTPDAYDTEDNIGDDDSCANATAVAADGVAQSHNLARTGGVADEDWIKFDAVSGVEYTIEAKPDGENGADADLYINLQPDCDLPSFGGVGAKAVFRAPESKTYYVLTGHNDAEYGPNTDYTITVSGQTECKASFEPNNLCNIPAEFPLSTGSQTHSFCEESDEDWIRFEVKAGGQYKVSTENIGSNADAQLSIFASCDTSGLPGQSLEFTAPSAGYYYIKAENKEPALAGLGTEYKVNIDVLSDGCEEDIYEQDDNTASAQILSIDSNSQSHNICPKGDEDWVKIEATKGTTFTVETLDLAKDADSYLCIFDRSGNKLNCDRDNGAGPGSRVIMKNVSDDIFYARISDENSDVAGSTTEYKLRAYTSRTRIADSHEPDNTQEQAKEITTDGTAHVHNIHVADDTDWLKFTATADSYVIKTKQVGAEGDTELALFNGNGDLLEQNDDFTEDSSSQIGYEFTEAGQYFLRVRLYNPTNFGSGTEYEVTVEPGVVDDTPPIDQEPPGPPPATPPPPTGEIETLILVNAARLSTLYPDAPESDNVTTLLTKLDQLARHPKVNGEVIQLNRNAEVSEAYAAWTGTEEKYLSVESANLVTDSIRRLIMSYLADHGGVKYVVLVGDDRALPLRRVIDATPQQPEETYTRVNVNHPTGAAIRGNYFLTDDFFVDKEPVPHKGREVYVPDLAIGRLIEKPSDMNNLIDIFLAEPVTEVNDVFVSGYDFVQDSASLDCTNWRRALGNDTKVTCVIGENWSKSDLLDNQTSTDPVFAIQSINGHADHDREGVPGNDKVLATEINDAVFALPGGLVYSLACHGGLNVPSENETLTVDLAESFVRKGSNYIGNSGYGWGYRGAIGLSEQVIQLFTTRLVEGGPMGEALASAKREYYRVTQVRTGYDEKVMQQFVFYGLPMFETIGGGSLSGDPFAGLVDDTFNDSPGSLGPEQPITKTISFDFSQAPLPLSTSEETTEGDTFGSYPTLAGYSYAEPSQPVQPLYFKDVTVATNEIRSVVVRRVDINNDVATNFDPVVATPDNEFITPTEAEIAPLGSVADTETESAWYPATIVDVQSLNGESTLATRLGQFNPATNEQRTFDNLEVDVYYSLSSDLQKPDFTLIDGLVTPDCGTDAKQREVTVKVGVQDSSGIEEVTLQYVVDGQQATGSLESVNMTYDASAQKWVGKYAGNCNSRFQISAMDKAFNRAFDNKKGERYAPVPARLDSLAPVGGEIYLPLVQN